ncbi:CheR family methyltransferase [Geoalkalibacter halelectricus]|uniref:protein-glutamate O-methyltransferase n=1 Tax=Geoalkalibacter halelectricus TaxID=2847045 RepID=A0ABY5ZP56_9BACT|nr:protein-glutamate O-methyltransferase CheR [Geoalkalibacter halelectricus]MDO3378386.1 protein-glutamate O-methyltransferase CheR [Geoalkalibacter halelectricus]UWZ80294.1 protein-glutamate O-methyltransferase CheR [Geoalkalibacter halelectricus]
MSLFFEEAPGGGALSHFLGEDVDAAAFEEVRQILLHRRGFDLGMYKDGCIRRRIAARVRAHGFREPRPYLELLVRDDAEVDALMAALSIQVSQFFRNPSTFELLHDQVLPDLFRRLRREGRRELRVWSLGCAGGEEPYSLAILLDQLVPPRMTFSIRAGDISPSVLARAREGLYEPARLGALPQDWRDKYFSRERTRLRLNERIRALVQFEECNVLGGLAWGEADLILCRNVLIYFSRGEQERVLRDLAEGLAPGGVLVLGRAETLIGESRALFSILSPAERIFLRTATGHKDAGHLQGAW